MKQHIKKLEQDIPKLTGIYFFKNTAGEFIYIGKAKNLQSRVNSYFKKYETDWKINQLLNEYASIDYIVTPTETESLLLEAQLVQKHKPKFNVLLKEGQPFLYIVFTNNNGIPSVELVRNKKQKGIYFGPFLQKMPTRKAYQFLMRTFRLKRCNKRIENGCLDYHIGNCAGSCRSHFDVVDYQFRVNLAMDVLKNNQNEFIKTIEKQMMLYCEQFAFEKAKHLDEYLHNVDTIFATLNRHFSENKFETDIFVVSTPTPYERNIAEESHEINRSLQNFLQVKTPISTIDCFDISHFQSSYLVGSCVRFTNGKSEKAKFRRFKIKTLDRQNDYAALQEIVQRRYRDKSELPDLILIDGGKGQLSAVKHILPDARIISLAKREETLYGEQFPEGIILDQKTDVGKLLIALRDYAHHFAISYHRLKRSQNAMS